MRLRLPETLLEQHARSEKILQEIHQLRLKPYLTEGDLRRIVELKVKLTRLSPPERYGWIDGRPRIDILAELVKIERQATR